MCLLCLFLTCAPCVFVMPCVFCFVLTLRPTCLVTSCISLSSSTTPVLLISLLVVLISFSCLLFASHQLSVSPPVFKFSLPFVLCLVVT